jgi:dTDP-4-dehydrorhamnose 3,5-epimerase
MSDRFDPSSYTELRASKTDIPGLLVIALAVFGDERGWFKENYNREKMTQIGLPASFDPLQQNVAHNDKRGVTRGIHAEPWDKYITIAAGSAFAAIVDFRKGQTYGKTLTFELNPGIGLFVPRGCGNSYQTLDDDTVYTYLVNDYWSADAKYVSVNLADPDLKIQWPIPLDMAEISPKDKSAPHFKDIQPMEV